MAFSDDMIAKLRKEFPKTAIETKVISVVDEYIQTGYKSQYIIERLNDTFGHDGWRIVVMEEKETPRECGAKVMLEILQWDGQQDQQGNFIPTIAKVIASRTQWGSSMIDAGRIFDAKKGAITNGLCKCASMLDVGQDSYKGELKDPNFDYKEFEQRVKEAKSGKTYTPTSKKYPRTDNEQELSKLKELCDTKGVKSSGELKTILGLKEDNIDFKTVPPSTLKTYIATLEKWQRS